MEPTSAAIGAAASLAKTVVPWTGQICSSSGKLYAWLTEVRHEAGELRLRLQVESRSEKTDSLEPVVQIIGYAERDDASEKSKAQIVKMSIVGWSRTGAASSQ